MNTPPTPASWINKTLAFLHDPPEKAYDFSRRHQERAEHYASALGLSTKLLTEKDADWAAAAADRFIFPNPSKVNGLGFSNKQDSFKHPVSGSALNLEVPDQDVAEGCLSDALPGQVFEDDQERFFVLWRTWMSQAASQPQGKFLPYLPADTRIPDGSIWNHMSVVSALEGTRDAEGTLRPALFMFQLGPVQEFIAQARTTRDLWSGSYLLSWLTAHGIKALTDELGPDAVIFPSLRGQPLIDWLHQDILKKATYRKADGNASESFWEALHMTDESGKETVLTPNLPNRFLAIVPEGFDGEKISTAVRAEWNTISQEVFGFLNQTCPLPKGAEKAWGIQVDQFLQPTWQRWDWEGFDETLTLAEQLPGELANVSQSLCDAASAIPAEERDDRCFPSSKRPDNLGLLWSAHYQLLSHRLAGRRATRDFTAWESAIGFRQRDALSGKEEALITQEWLAKAQKHPQLQHYFRNSQRLGAVNLVKRLWHLAYLNKKHHFKRSGTKFESVIDVAAGKWKAEIKEVLKKRQDPWMVFQTFAKIAAKASRTRDWEGAQLNSAKEEEFIEKIPGEFLIPEGWDSDSEDSDDERKLLTQARDALTEFHKSAKLKNPPAYYAVIALDGDQIGKFLSGEKTPVISGLLSENATSYFARIKPDWVGSHRPLSPSYHLGFSEALGNFGLYAARRVVEAHYGQLIYSGGDDVLAMVPAEEAISCVVGLRMAFQGDRGLASRYSKLFAEPPAEGMIQLAVPESHEPSWPLLVPGKTMNVSAGVVIAHVKAALQDCVQAAQTAEKRAKRSPENGGLGRNALALTLFKRSGETIEWGASFEPGGGLELLTRFQDLYRRDKTEEGSGIPGGFPSRVAGLISRFDSDSGDLMTEDLIPLVRREIEWSWDQMQSAKKLSEEKESFFLLLDDYLKHLADPDHQRPIRDVSNLFTSEAFLKRQRA